MPDPWNVICSRVTNSVELVVALLNYQPHIISTTLSVVPVPSNKTSRPIAKDPSIQSLNDEALDLRSKYNVPYWMAVLLTAQRREVPLPPQVIAASAFHQPMTEANTEEVEASAITADYLTQRSSELPSRHILTISSRVTLRNLTVAHIPMLDFRISPSPEALATVTAVLQELNITGVVLDSGQSYHFYGASLLSAESLPIFLGRALLFTPIVDYRWIAHQLIEGACALRISPGIDKQQVPRIVARV